MSRVHPVRLAAEGRPVRIRLEPMVKAPPAHKAGPWRAMLAVSAIALAAALILAVARLAEYSAYVDAAARV